jgi:hypothetical protein
MFFLPLIVSRRDPQGGQTPRNIRKGFLGFRRMGGKNFGRGLDYFSPTQALG